MAHTYDDKVSCTLCVVYVRRMPLCLCAVGCETAFDLDFLFLLSFKSSSEELETAVRAS